MVCADAKPTIRQSPSLVPARRDEGGVGEGDPKCSDQLLTETRAGVTTTYTYDANGNRASKAAGGTTETYTVDDADKLTNIKVGTTTIKSYGYDAAGRTTSVVSSAGTTTLAYDYEGRISTITYPSSATNSFTYNGLDTRVGKVDSAGTTTYRRDGDYVLAPVLEAGGTKFTPGISRRTGTTSAFYHADRLGSNTRQTSTAQGSIASRQYDAFGNLAATSGTWTGPFGFAGGYGYQEDTESGLQLLGQRYYDSSTGRFLTRDPIKDGRNWYGFVGNNPLRWVDPEGTMAALALPFIVAGPPGWVIGGAIVVAVVAVVAIKMVTERCPWPDGNVPDDPTKGPPDWVWRGKPLPDGGYVNPEDPGESVHPDLDHGGEIGPHWDWNRRGVRTKRKLRPGPFQVSSDWY